MDNVGMLAVLRAIIASASLLLVGLTLYTAYFGVFPDGIQRSAHLLLIMVLVFTLAFRDTFDPELAARGLLLKRLWIIVAMVAGVLAVAHQLFNFDAINSRYGSILPFEVFLGTLLVITLFDACRRTIGWPIVLLASVFILYGLYGNYLPSPFGHRGYSLERVASQIISEAGGSSVHRSG
ncbi:hypothetical protein ACM25N_12220 [Roseovarius sp. C7]|uniref:hypothetical protein n=1 Tax=Roseovarius sp. C7 TaxID=3398643 RepID=UPI0039F6C880